MTLNFSVLIRTELLLLLTSQQMWFYAIDEIKKRSLKNCVDLDEYNNWVRALFGPDAPRPLDGPFVSQNVMQSQAAMLLY
jgi:hypothetical protein